MEMGMTRSYTINWEVIAELYFAFRFINCFSLNNQGKDHQKSRSNHEICAYYRRIQIYALIGSFLMLLLTTFLARNMWFMTKLAEIRLKSMMFLGPRAFITPLVAIFLEMVPIIIWVPIIYFSVTNPGRSCGEKDFWKKCENKA